MKNVDYRYFAKEILVGCIINGALSIFFCYIKFSKYNYITPWGSTGYATDFVPQTFMISLMSTLAPTIITRKRMAMKKIKAVPKANTRLPHNLLLRALMMAFFFTALFSIAAITLASHVFTGPIGFTNLLVLKFLYGVIVSTVVTFLSVRMALADSPARSNIQNPASHS
ncbi:hypothetical protein J8402_01360 [Chromohalobacter israelensis]|uniref:hypothetical protein n=1 Tax=Chromohalobacter israelensis TaxID=141390 RepID=UPI003AF5E8ED